ncbi:MAG: GNAT family N-acetyltransferase [Bryobacterales bacterium]|nr:GNAT family N-acetyltransferase [Bryobacterales bacterium]
MRALVLKEWRQLEAMEADWRSLWQADPRATPFQSPEWMGAWWPVFGSGELLAITVWKEEQLQTMGLFFLHLWEGRRQVTFVGNGVSDRQLCLVRPGVEREALGCLWQALDQHGGWDLCDLQDIPSDAAMLALAANPAVPQYPGRAICLGDSWQDYHAALPHGLRRNLDRYRRQLEQAATVEFLRLPVPEGMHALFALHGTRWQQKDGTAGMFSGHDLQRFHLDAACRLGSRVRMNALLVNGQVAGVNYLLLDGDTAYGYACGFHPQWARYSPGTLLLGWGLERAMMEGMRRFDFLRGDEPYKSQWGASPYQTMRLQLWPK